MNNQQIKQRLIEAALTDTIPETPSFDFPQSKPLQRLPHWIGYAAAACIVAAIVFPLNLHQPTENIYADSATSTKDTALELEEAFAMIDQHFSASSNNLINMIQ